MRSCCPTGAQLLPTGGRRAGSPAYAHTTTRPGDRSAGYGLGLAVAKFIIEAHKGEIRVESEVGVGSRFTFWIPVRPADATGGSLINVDVDDHAAA